MKRLWWKAYFFLMLVLTVIGIGFAPFFLESPERDWWDWIFIPMYCLQLVGLFGFAYWRPIAVPLIWRATFAVSIPYEVWNMASLILEDGPSHGLMIFMIGVAIAMLLIQGPLFIAIYRYGFKCKELWHGAT
jgi:hypothetical protein